ncbi:MAG TPA: SPFH domain-containing protein [Opitutaceae bacterium]|jgi:regulator of protease activity HflC (stomatin/prohibitin superfamily)
MIAFFIAVAFGFAGTFVAVGIFIAFGRIFQFWRILPERTVIVYTNFGKVIGEVGEPGMFFPILHFGPKAFLLPFFGRAYTVTNSLQQSYLRNQLVNSEEGAPMGVGVWYEMYVQNSSAFLFQNSDPIGSLRANVATAVSRQLSNLKLETLLEDRDALSSKVREEVSPVSLKWGFQLGSTYIRKVAFRDRGMIAQIELKVVNRLRQVTAAMRQNGDNQVALIHSDADKKASEKLGQAQAVRPQVVGTVLADVQKNPDVADALFKLLDIKATLKSPGKVLIAPGNSVGLLLQS